MPRTNLIIVSIFAILILLIAGGYLLSITNKLSQIPLSSKLTPQTSSLPDPSHLSGETTSQINIYLIALEDNGQSGKKIGCDDSVVPVKQNINKTNTPLKLAVEKLFSIKSQNFGESGLYNALYQSNIKVDEAKIDATGSAILKLSGNITLGGVCDSPRFKSQLQETAMQFPTVKSVSIFINDELLDEALSQK
jgi:hypothetical protein